MPINGKLDKCEEDGVEKDAFVVTFTNGALRQLEDLQKYFEAPGLLDVVTLGISALQGFKEQTEARAKKSPSPESDPK